jgi:hypothetical protein
MKARVGVLEKDAEVMRRWGWDEATGRIGRGCSRWCRIDGRGSEGSIARWGRGIRRIGVEMKMKLYRRAQSSIELFDVGESSVGWRQPMNNRQTTTIKRITTALYLSIYGPVFLNII